MRITVANFKRKREKIIVIYFASMLAKYDDYW